ncbi:class I SAM-dependent methyltransferase [Chlorogloeopsis sp. ULAP02]|uniref:class I SAM-dependent methyltransferase n=1 Tax=Chlorogloeopsis sp. ULAP02 TaxID=3107926 RepID=UPI003135716E
MSSFPTWYFDESQIVGIDFEDIAQVETFDCKQTSSAPEIEQVLVKRLGISSGHTIIDLGAGTGTFAIQAALKGASVHAIDISRSMLAYAQQKARKMGATTIKFHRDGFLTYKHNDDLADFVITKAALHILPDFWKMVALMRVSSMLKPNGILYLRDVIFSFPISQYEASIDEWIEHSSKPEGEGWTVKDYQIHMREEHSTFAWIIEGMLTRAGFEITQANYLTPTAAEYVCIKTA